MFSVPFAFFAFVTENASFARLWRRTNFVSFRPVAPRRRGTLPHLLRGEVAFCYVSRQRRQRLFASLALRRRNAAFLRRLELFALNAALPATYAPKKVPNTPSPGLRKV